MEAINDFLLSAQFEKTPLFDGQYYIATVRPVDEPGGYTAIVSTLNPGGRIENFILRLRLKVAQFYMPIIFYTIKGVYDGTDEEYIFLDNMPIDSVVEYLLRKQIY